MPIPTYQDAMLPVLRALEDTNERHIGDIVNVVINGFGLTESEREQMLPSGQSTVIGSRIGWARTYLNKANLIEKMLGRGIYKITGRGLEVLKRNPERIDNNLLSEFPGFTEWIRPKKEENVVEPDNNPLESDQTPDESLELAYRTLRTNLSTEILDKVKSCSPVFFERLVVELLVKMGYGGSRRDAGQAIGKSGDGGIDGIIKEDRLGLDVIYIQAKRWENTVGRPEIHQFAGALQEKRAKKGVFLTTSDFSKGAREFAAAIDNKIILIGGEELADYMIDFNVGVSIAANYEVKRIDSDYFIEE
jgi:restriction system protein